MTVKAVDAALIADKALDVFAARALGGNRKCSLSAMRKAAAAIFDEVLDAVVAECRGKHARVVVCVGCYPLMRARGVSALMTRLICRNSTFLRENGISSGQFLDCFEKYIRSKCRFEKTEHYGGYVVFLKEKHTFCSDWMRLLSEHFGSAILDQTECGVFADRPHFISTMESDGAMYTPIPADVEFKDRQIVESL